MVSLPKFTKRAAEQIARLEAEGRSHVPPGSYLSFIGWENEVEPGSSRAPLFRAYYFFSDADGVPEEFQVACHGVKLAYNIPERLLAKLQSSVLDFDGEGFVFVESGDAELA